jgi:hypothetical protein
MCGGLIHPIAGKCKHCKGDLAGVRGGRPAAAQALPSIIATNTAARPASTGPASSYAPPGLSNGSSYNGHNGHSNGQYAPIPMAAQHVAMPMQLARQYEEHAGPSILPPRPTGRQYATAAPRAAWWKSWPLIVIVLAVLAIVTAVVLMVWPPGKSAAEGEPTKANKMLPAPERMETNPLPPKADLSPTKPSDPWNDNQPGAKIDIPDDPDDDLAGPTPPPGRPAPGRSTITGAGAVMLEVSTHFCDRAAACSNDDLLKALCTQTKDSMKLFDVQPPTSCASRTRCLQHVDTLDCTVDFTMSGLTQLTTKVQDCVEAVTRC